MLINYVLIFLLFLVVGTLKYKTCPERTGEGHESCDAQPNCIFYEWHLAGHSCYYNCEYYDQSQSECMLLFNCKWYNGKCVQKECLDFTYQGPDTCWHTPGCKWYWNKCRKETCSVLEASDLSECSRTFCNWNQQTKECSDKTCAEYVTPNTCDGVFACEWTTQLIEEVEVTGCYDYIADVANHLKYLVLSVIVLVLY